MSRKQFRCEDRLKDRAYSDPRECMAFRQGYGDGYAGSPQGDHGRYPQAYNAGYWEGFEDKPNDNRGFD